MSYVREECGHLLSRENMIVCYVRVWSCINLDRVW